MANDSQVFLNRCLLFDIETNENGEIYGLGAFYNGKKFNTPQGRKVTKEQLAEFDSFGRSAEFVLGHNILSHDIPCLREREPDLAILQKQVIDTLYLSPLAFPENPYHRLVKNYQIVRDSINNPAEDAVLAGRVFTEQWDAFLQLLAGGSDTPLIYRGFFCRDDRFAGTSAAFEAMGVPLLEGDDLYETFSWLVQKDVCMEALERLVEQLHDLRIEHPPLAYVTAWLTISRENNSLHLLNHDGTPVARLAKTAQTRWQDRMDAIKEIMVIALAYRYKTDIKDKEYQARCRSDSWEVPVVELRYLGEG